MPSQAVADSATKPLDAYKRDAARLLKAARAGDAQALGRFARLDHPPTELQLKHALAVIAQEAGFDSWTSLKQTSEGLDFSEFFTAPGLKDSINHWFSTYDEAKAHQAAHGGILLPYRHQCFVTSDAILARLGFEADDPDWADMGYDWVKPALPSAHAAVKARLERRFTKTA